VLGFRGVARVKAKGKAQGKGPREKAQGKRPKGIGWRRERA